MSCSRANFAVRSRDGGLPLLSDKPRCGCLPVGLSALGCLELAALPCLEKLFYMLAQTKTLFLAHGHILTFDGTHKTGIKLVLKLLHCGYCTRVIVGVGPRGARQQTRVFDISKIARRSLTHEPLAPWTLSHLWVETDFVLPLRFLPSLMCFLKALPLPTMGQTPWATQPCGYTSV